MIERFWGLCVVHCSFIKEKAKWFSEILLSCAVVFVSPDGRAELFNLLSPTREELLSLAGCLCLSMDPSEAYTLPCCFCAQTGSLLHVGGVGWDRCPSEAANAVFITEHSSCSFQASAQRCLSTFGWWHWKNSGSQVSESPQCSAELRTFISEAASSKSMAEGGSDL